MIWNKAEIKNRLYRWWEFHNYCADYHYTTEIVGIPPRKRSRFEPRFVSQAIDNALFDEAFGLLNDTEQQLLIRLYMDGGYDRASQGEPNIWVNDDVWETTKVELDVSGKELSNMVDGALEKMMAYLNS